MKDKFYGDKRDPVKWGGIVYLCTVREKDIKTVVQVAYYREDEPVKIKFDDESQKVNLPDPVKRHFIRDVRDIKRLGRRAKLKILVIRRKFNRSYPDDYRYHQIVCEKIKRINERKVVLLDPDTGLASNKCKDKKVKLEHVKPCDVRLVWESLKTGDFLVFYQQNPRLNKWENRYKSKLAKACKVNRSQVRMWWSDGIAKDVVFYFIEK